MPGAGGRSLGATQGFASQNRPRFAARYALRTTAPGVSSFPPSCTLLAARRCFGVMIGDLATWRFSGHAQRRPLQPQLRRHGMCSTRSTKCSHAPVAEARKFRRTMRRIASTKTPIAKPTSMMMVAFIAEVCAENGATA